MPLFQATVEVTMPIGRFKIDNFVGILTNPIEYESALIECEKAADCIRTGNNGFQFYNGEGTLIVLPPSLCNEVLFQLKVLEV